MNEEVDGTNIKSIWDHYRPSDAERVTELSKLLAPFRRRRQLHFAFEAGLFISLTLPDCSQNASLLSWVLATMNRHPRSASVWG